MNIPTPGQVFPKKVQVLVNPIRSTQCGGKWHHCRIPPDGQAPTVPEIDRAIENIPEVIRQVVRAQFEQKWERATRGSLIFGKHDDVGEIVTRPPILFEMRVNYRANANRERDRYLYRLYFAEPIDLPEVMLALKFARKTADGDPLNFQQEHIEKAGERFHQGLSNDYRWGYDQDNPAKRKEGE